MQRFEGRSLPAHGFAGDLGTANPELADTLGRYAVDAGRAPEVLLALASARLLVPVIALPAGEVTGSPHEDHTHEDHADEDHTEEDHSDEGQTDMALVTLTRPDGESALPAFTSLASLAAWRSDARPVPVDAARAALSAAAEGAVALVVDPAGPVAFVVSGPALRLLAEGAVQSPLYAGLRAGSARPCSDLRVRRCARRPARTGCGCRRPAGADAGS